MNLSNLSDEQLKEQIFDNKITLQCGIDEKWQEEIRRKLIILKLESTRRKLMKVGV